MDIGSFEQLLGNDEPPEGLSNALQALWYKARGNWDAAHTAAQDDEGRDGSWVHGYLHRKEGDEANAGYWYRRAGQTFPSSLLADEWRAIAAALLASETRS